MTRRDGSQGPQPYDFRRPIKLSREHVRLLQIVFEQYARSCSTLLTTRLRAVSNVSLLAIEQLTYDEYIGTLTSPTVVASVTVAPLPGQILLELPLSTAMTSIDHMLGGPGGTQPARQLTEVEVPLLRGLFERMLGELRYGFEQLVDITPRLGALEYNPQFIRAAAPSDPVVVASFEMKVGTEETVASVCLPFTTVLPVLRHDKPEEKLSEAEQLMKRNAQQKIGNSLSTAPVDVAVRFRSVRMRTNDIVDLRPGDVVALGHPVAAPLMITVNDTTFGYAVPGNQGSRLACLVVPPPKEENNS